MKIRVFFISVLLLCGISAFVISEKASVQPVNEKKMIEKAIQENDTPQLIKELITHLKSELEIDWERFPELIKEVDAYRASSKDSASAAVLHSMLADMYNMYFQQNRWNINQRTSISGYIPDDIREWSGNLFTDKINQEIELSLQPAELLTQIPASRFQAIIKSNERAVQPFEPTLYDFLIQRAINLQSSDDLYKRWIAFRNTQPDERASLLVELEYLEYKYNSNRNESNRLAYGASLDSLMQVYGSKNFSTEIRIAQVDFMNYSFGRNTDEDSVRTLQYRLIKDGIAQFPGYDRIGILKNKLASMEEPVFSSTIVNTVYPGKDFQVRLNYRNVPSITVQIYKSLKTPVDIGPYGEARKNDTRGKLVKETTIPLEVVNTYSSIDTTLNLSIGQLGLYECVITVPGQKMTNSHLISVSRLAAVHRGSALIGNEIYVTDYESGKPIQNATVTYYGGQRQSLKSLGTIQTDKNGLALIPRGSKAMAYQASVEEDKWGRLSSIYDWQGNNQAPAEDLELNLFTDRGLYRPGQTIYFKGIAYRANNDDPQVVANKTFTVILRDANYKEVTNKKFTTNEFGSFNGEFTLPTGVFNGNFTLMTDIASTYVRVEEYKRPTFAVDILPVKDEIAFGDQITIEGKVKTFSGAELRSGDVSWRIIRRPLWPRFPSQRGTDQVASGKTTIQDNGLFTLSFTAAKSDSPDSWSNYERFEVIATVTDSKGETQESQYTFSVGDASILLSSNITDLLEKDSAKVIISAQTLNGEKIKTTGSYKLMSLAEDGKDRYEMQLYKEVKQVVAGTFTSEQQISQNVFNQLPSGRYRLMIDAKDSKGRLAKQQQDFVLYSKRDKQPPIDTHTWLVTNQVSVLPGEEAEIIFGTSDKDAYILYELYANGKYIHRTHVKLNNENKTWKIPFKEEYNDGVSVSFTFIKDGKLYTQQVPVMRKRPDRSLTIKPETFRDRLLPGSKENWKFRITDADSLAVSAEMLAGLYDASLDKILPFKWFFSPTRNVNMWRPTFSEGESLYTSDQYANAGVKTVPVKEYAFNQLDWQGIMDGRYMYRTRRSSLNGVMGLSKAVAAPMAAVDQMQADMEMTAGVGDEVLAESTVQQSQDGALPPPPPSDQSASASLRQNFNETAFFYPVLRTNESGDILISFTMPESNTSWKFQALAHTKDLKYGSFTQEVITSKPLMVLPNLPRFVREEDKVSFSTQVINQSEKEITGRSRIELFDPNTDRVIAGITNQERSFVVEAGNTASVSWDIQIPKGISLIGIRMIADSEEASDGEQHILPVLSGKIMVTESTPFYLLKQGEQRIKIGSPNTSAQPYRMTLEISGNPVWYAVQALPTLTEPNNENILSWFASYYSNILATSMVNQQPRLQQVIRQWAAQGGDATTLLSNLEKNEELKDILLQETPWVLAADNESEQKQRLSLLFDLNRAESMRERALQELLKQQKEDGGWGWFQGFTSSRSMTLAVLRGMSQLIQLNAVEYNQAEKEMQMNALRYLDKRIQEDYESLKKHNKQWKDAQPSSEQIEYLFVRSFYRDIPELGDAREAIRFYTDQAQKNWTKLSIHEKADIAVLMHRNGKKDVANEILAWFRKTATTSDEKGMYWANNRRGSNYLVSPIETHSLLMYAFKEMDSNQAEIDRMKQWLLNQKRTQNWESVPATLNAIHAILFTGSDWLSENNKVTAQWGNQTISTTDGDAAVGYIKQTVPADRIPKGTHELVLQKEGNNPAWGAVYNQYFEELDKVQGQKGVLNVEKKLFVEVNNELGRQIVPVSDDRKLRLGDKIIVRLTIRTDREMNYVSLKDLRAGCFEPAEQLSGTEYRDGVSYYRSPRDVSENFFFDRLPEGTFVLEYPVYVSRTGEYAGGISTIQCMYAPEFVSHTEGSKLIVVE